MQAATNSPLPSLPSPPWGFHAEESRQTAFLEATSKDRANLVNRYLQTLLEACFFFAWYIYLVDYTGIYCSSGPSVVPVE